MAMVFGGTGVVVLVCESGCVEIQNWAIVCLVSGYGWLELVCWFRSSGLIELLILRGLSKDGFVVYDL